jgi:hypothetical protein
MELSFMVGFWLTGFWSGHLVEAIALVPINRYVDIIILPEVVDGTVVVVAFFYIKNKCQN